MNIVLLSGGSGQRLWPLSNDIRSKQFIKIFRKADGTLESMVQRVYRQIKTVDPEAVVTIATSKSQVSAINNQLGENVGISVEPCRRDTFPAIALADTVIAEKAYQDFSRLCYEEAKQVMFSCKKVICCQTIFGTQNERNRQLLNEAEAAGMEIELWQK